MSALTNPELQSAYADSNDANAKNIQSMKEHYYRSSYPQNAAMWQQGAIDKRFKAGDQTLWSMFYGGEGHYQKRRFFFNMIRKHINMIAGYQRKHRKSTLCLPRNDSDSLVDSANKLIKWSETFDGFQEYFSQSFENAADVGINLLHLYIDYSKDFYSGDLYTDSVSYNNFLIDPYFRKQDLSDCNFLWRRRWVSKEIAKALLPGREKEIDKLQPQNYKDGRFPLQAELCNMDLNRLLSYDEFYYKSSREALMIIDTKTQETTEWKDTSEEGIKDLDQIMYFQPWLQKHKTHVSTVKLNIAINDKSFYNGKNLLSIDSYPFIPMLCYHEPDMQNYTWKIQGVIRNLRDAQYLYNRRKVIELDILESQINSGWIFPTDAVEDVKAFRQTGQGFLIPLKKGKSVQDIQRISPPDIPQSLMALSDALKQDITEISGVTEELLGSAEDDQSGILNMLRQGAALTTLQTIFDKADYSQRLYGKIRLMAILNNFTKAKITNILGYEPPKELFDMNVEKYQLTVEEGAYTATQRQTELQQLLHFKNLGIPITNKTILQKAYITDKEQVIADMEEEQQQQQQQQMQQMQQQSEQQEKKDNIEAMAKYAKAKLDIAKSAESEASATEKISETTENVAQSEYIRTARELELVKMMIELEDMDLQQIKNSLEIVDKIKSKDLIEGGRYERLQERR